MDINKYNRFQYIEDKFKNLKNRDDMLLQENKSLKEQIKILMYMVKDHDKFNACDFKHDLGTVDFLEYVELCKSDLQQENTQLKQELKEAYGYINIIKGSEGKSMTKEDIQIYNFTGKGCNLCIDIDYVKLTDHKAVVETLEKDIEVSGKAVEDLIDLVDELKEDKLTMQNKIDELEYYLSVIRSIGNNSNNTAITMQKISAHVLSGFPLPEDIEPYKGIK